MEGGGVSLVGQDNSPSSPPPIGGCLSLFLSQWEASISDAWVLNTISLGLSLEFTSLPPSRFIPCPISQDKLKRDLVSAAIDHLFQIAAIERVPLSQQGQGFYSRLFVVKKSSGGWRAILDLKSLNLHIKYRRFKMQSLSSILESVRPSDFLSSIDLMEAYLHVPILPAHRQFLRFAFRGFHYQYRALPFGLSSAPRVLRLWLPL